jgi:hypothetical protein
MIIIGRDFLVIDILPLHDAISPNAAFYILLIYSGSLHSRKKSGVGMANLLRMV